jgi:hypothetical protein
MKKSVLIIFLILIFLLVNLSVLAEDEAKVEKAYACLKNKLGDNCGDTENTVENSFNLLAMAHDSGINSDCKSSLEKKKKNNCWGVETDSDSCSIKSTAIAILALKTIGANVDNSIKWLASKKELNEDLIWFLEIDTANSTECEINGEEIIINENKKITGSNPSGLSKAYDDYWFEIKDIEENYSISCDKNFVTAVLYQKKGGNVYHVSSETHSGAAFDSTNEKVESYCFADSEQCNYEGSLWAALALAKAGKDISPYIPYIYAMSDEIANRKYLPYAFLSMLYSNVDEYSSELIKQQKQNKLWEEGGNKFHDSALAILALSSEHDAVKNTKNYLLTQQNSDGCWPSDTSFILYAGWQKTPASTETAILDCENSKFFCISRGECSLEKIKDSYCPTGKVCCEAKPKELTCEEKRGMVCPDSTSCTEPEVISFDTNFCCTGDCLAVPGESECEQADYSCRISCSKNEEEKSLSCGAVSGKVCCTEKTATGSWTLILLLIILIILVVLAIIFRNQLKIWWFKLKSGFKTGKGPPPTNRPSFPAQFSNISSPRQIIPRHMIPARRPLARRPLRGSDKDKEFEETMKKLRDMSK